MLPFARVLATSQAYDACLALRWYRKASLRSKSLREQFQEAASKLDVEAARSLLKQWESAGGSQQPIPRRLALFNQMCTVYMKTRQVDKVMNLAEVMKKRGLGPDHITYSVMLNACSKGAIDEQGKLPVKLAKQAQEIFDQMKKEGIVHSDRHHRALMIAHAKAGMVDECQKASEAVSRPGKLEMNILLDACSKSGDTARARETLRRFQSIPGVQPDNYTWSTLLTAYGRAEDVDGAYKVWLEMQAAGVVPDSFVMKALNYCFRGMPTLARDINKEARELMDPAITPSSSAGMFELDLHYMSNPSARVAILRKLDELKDAFGEGTVEAAGLSERGEGEGHGSGRPAGKLQDLCVVVGRGRRSVGTPQLKATTVSTFKAMGLEAEQDPRNEGRLLVSAPKLVKYLQEEQKYSLKSRSLHSAALQASVVLMGSCALLAATYLIPKILS